MVKYLTAYLAVLVVMVLLDVLWIGVIAKPLYLEGIGHLMAPQPNVPVAVLFYGVYAAGLMYFVVGADAAASGWMQTLIRGALFGFFAYATYDLTNLATLRDWPITLSIVDMMWGSLISAASASAGRMALNGSA